MCGVVGVYNVPNAPVVVRDLLSRLQHRGQQSAGIAVYNDNWEIQDVKGKGLVKDVFSNGSFESLSGSIAIGHVRYSTTGGTSPRNIQPIIADHQGYGDVAIAHNGDFVKFKELRERIGGFYQTTTDTEIMFHLIHNSPASDLEHRILDAAHQVHGAYALVMLAQKKLFALRDPPGFRPLSFGRMGNGFVVASETFYFSELGATIERDVKPGEMIVFDGNEARSEVIASKPVPFTPCIFELIYFGIPANKIFDVYVDEFRKKTGQILALEDAKKGMTVADVVAPVPDSGNYSAMGYAQESRIPFGMVFVRDHYSGRSFIKPTQEERDATVKVKLFPVPGQVKGKRILLVDDSIIRANTIKRAVQKLYAFGAKEVHVRSASPMVVGDCRYGIDLKNERERIANTCDSNTEKIRAFIGSTSLSYLSLEGMDSAAKTCGLSSYCASCFTGKYPSFS